MEYASGTVGRVFLIRVDHGKDPLATIAADPEYRPAIDAFEHAR